MADNTATPVKVSSLFGALIASLKSVLALLPYPDASKKGAEARFDALYLGTVRAMRRQVDWDECDRCFRSLRKQLLNDTEVFLRYMLRVNDSGDISFKTVGDAANRFRQNREAVLSHPDAAGYTVAKEFGDQFAGRTARSLAEDLAEPDRMMQIIRHSRV